MITMHDLEILLLSSEFGRGNTMVKYAVWQNTFSFSLEKISLFLHQTLSFHKDYICTKTKINTMDITDTQ